MKKYLLFLIFASLVLSACGGQERSLNGSWVLTSYATLPAVEDSQAGITFDDEMVSGNSGCNGFSGEYTVEGDQITFGPLVSTLMACEDPLMSQEGMMFQVLNGTATYNIEGDTLTITKDGTSLVFTAGSEQ